MNKRSARAPHTPQAERESRRFASESGQSDSDSRTQFQRDRDRILYSDYCRRLTGVTQVVSAAEGGIFHNRLTHSLKVAQVARRLAERLIGQCPDAADSLSPDVAEAAGLAHDLGHPPFGHVAEKALCDLAANTFKLPDGFEGNAQTFRILTRLSVHRGRHFGLDLTRATLVATIKYPWLRDRGTNCNAFRREKYSVYDDDIDAFKFAFNGNTKKAIKSLETEVMDLADTITYSVHDLEDFYRAGLVPLERIAKNEAYRRAFLERWQRRTPTDSGYLFARDPVNMMKVINLIDFCLAEISEHGTHREAELLETFRSIAISTFLGQVKIRKERGERWTAEMPKEYWLQCKVLHEIVKQYVILSPRLATQQEGQVRVVRELAIFFRTALLGDRVDQIPTRFRAVAEDIVDRHPKTKKKPSPIGVREKSRLAIDIVASLTEGEALFLHRRITGHHSGSILDLVH